MISSLQFSLSGALALTLQTAFATDSRALAISVVVHGSVTADTITRSSFDGIYVCSDEQELPAVFLLLALDHLLDLCACVTVTCVLLSVGCNNEHRMLRHILGASILMNVSDVVNRTADGIRAVQPRTV